MLQKALIIEDEPEIRAILALSLQHDGRFETVCASDGLEGIEVAIRERPNVILLDVLMPRLDGYATCARLKRDSRLNHIPVIFLTAKTDPHDVDRAKKVGAAGCIAKPFDPLTLTAQIAKIVDGGGRTGSHTRLQISRSLNG